MMLAFLALLQAAAPEPAIEQAAAPVCERGIHLVTSAEPRTTRLLPEKLTDHRRMGNVLAGALFAGFSSMQVRSVLNGPRAELRLSDRRPVFLFCDPPAPSAPRQPASGIAYVGGVGLEVSPASFRLVRLDVKPEQRELPVADLGAFSGPKKSMSKRVIRVDVREIGPGIYEVSPKEALQPGEYAFFGETRTEVAAAAKKSIQDRVVDFAIAD